MLEQTNVQAPFTVINLSTAPAKDNKFYLTAIPIDPKHSEINPTGRFGFTYDQLSALAHGHGVQTPEFLTGIINKGDTVITIPATKRQIGDEFTDRYGNIRKYTKNWWEVDAINCSLRIGDVGAEYQNKIESEVIVANVKEQMKDTRDAARVRQMQAIARVAKMTGKSIDSLMGGDENAPEPTSDLQIDAPSLTPAQIKAAAKAEKEEAAKEN